MRPWEVDFDTVQEISHLIDDHIEWYDRILHAIANPANDYNKHDIAPINILIDFLDLYKDKELWSKKTEEGLRNHYSLIMSDCRAICEMIHEKQAVSTARVDSFRSGFLNFMFLLNKIRDHTTLISFGMDPYSSLKTKALAMLDIRKEMERKLRQDTPFSILLLKIENLHEVEDIFGRNQTQRFIRLACEKIEQKLRIFDDMYRMDHNEFLIAVKMTDRPGAMLFAQRIQRFFDDEQSNVRMGEYDIHVRLSMVLAEPVSGENIIDLINNMRDDLEEKSNPEGAIITFNEVAPIKKFLQKTS